jgi:hypothetical protein
MFGSKAGLNAGHATRLPGLGAKDVAIFDFNRDGFADLAVANSQPGANSYVYWGSAQGFAEARRTELPSLAANSVAVGNQPIQRALCGTVE